VVQDKWLLNGFFVVVVVVVVVVILIDLCPVISFPQNQKINLIKLNLLYNCNRITGGKCALE